METDQITLLNLDRDQNVSGGPQSKKQVAQRHHRRRPERDDEAQHQRMPQKFVNKWRPEANLLMLHRGICRNKKEFFPLQTRNPSCNSRERSVNR